MIEATNVLFFFFQAEDGIRDLYVTGVQTCALPISAAWTRRASRSWLTTNEKARHLPRGGARDAGARTGGRRGRRRRDRARLPVLGSAGGGPRDPARVGTSPLARNAHPRVPRRPRPDP